MRNLDTERQNAYDIFLVWKLYWQPIFRKETID